MKPSTGGLLKLQGDIHGWETAFLREISFVDGAYFLKIQGHRTDNHETEQIQIFLRAHDAALLVTNLEKLILTEGSNADKKVLELRKNLSTGGIDP